MTKNPQGQGQDRLKEEFKELTETAEDRVQDDYEKPFLAYVQNVIAPRGELRFLKDANECHKLFDLEDPEQRRRRQKLIKALATLIGDEKNPAIDPKKARTSHDVDRPEIKGKGKERLGDVKRDNVFLPYERMAQVNLMVELSFVLRFNDVKPFSELDEKEAQLTEQTEEQEALVEIERSIKKKFNLNGPGDAARKRLEESKVDKDLLTLNGTDNDKVDVSRTKTLLHNLIEDCKSLKDIPRAPTDRGSETQEGATQG